ncbi:hypothetical protein Scep_015129 [Stephania cephalantha]|uniref:Protein EARLY FLOWERING 4 domain-containing protein n=1 Tax=Stephania cephalantha TaxID=152367 RepID=A0AAP0J2P9_9MAGN
MASPDENHTKVVKGATNFKFHSFGILVARWDGLSDLLLGHEHVAIIRRAELKTLVDLHGNEKSFVQVQNIMDQNRLLINEINQNHESRIADNFSRNIDLIREVNNNIRYVVNLYVIFREIFQDLCRFHLRRAQVASLDTRKIGLLRRSPREERALSRCI